MAMIDYGAIAWKDGKLISTEMFTEMKDMVGWDDDGEYGLKGNYFAYIGDKDLTIGFYKNVMHVVDHDSIYFGWEKFEGWKKWENSFWVEEDLSFINIIVRKRKFHDYYICTMDYRGHRYKVAFGYGVDLAYYKRTHIIDYYGTPWFRINSWIKYTLKDKIKEIKWNINYRKEIKHEQRKGKTTI